ncbi:MAG: choice-of-anchor L domain-containing protein [Rhodospirillales bacterium]|jgi:hypothetical protein|nr:choice-of-anchor L domain-containing protein [Rhodospirillales bacterium]
MKALFSRLVAAGLVTSMFCVLTPARAALLSVTGTSDVNTLMAALFSGSSDFLISGAALIGVDDQLGTQQGTFSGGNGIGSGGLGVDSGIIMTSGFAESAAVVNNSGSTTAELGTVGDTNLDALVGGLTVDANVLTFQFKPTKSGVLRFRFVFASEEYNEVGDPGDPTEFDDVFGLFVDGVNKATAGAGPVSINNINCGYGSRDDLTLPNTGPNCNLFRNNNFSAGNTPPDPLPPYDLQYDGLTTVLSVTLDLNEGQTYAVKLAIADRQDRATDSAVFIEGAFRADGNGTVPEPASTSLAAIALLSLAAALNRGRLRAARQRQSARTSFSHPRS